jgi:alkylhydroperoxidase family enzyme
VQGIYDYVFGPKDPVGDPGGPGGTPGNWWTVMALVPDALVHATAGIAFYRNPARKIDPQLRELGMIRTGWLRSSQFVYSQHCKACRDVGLSEEQVQAIPSWSTASCFSDVQRAVLAYTDALVLEGGRVPDGTWEALHAALSEEEILELTYITMTYELHATMCRALRLEFDDKPDPLVEVAGPRIAPYAEEHKA